jgi:nitroreductase
MPTSELLGDKEGRALVAAATAAPSLHNSQPWAFAIGPRHVEVYADAGRQLRTADAAGRSLLISCGAALFNLRVAAERLGFHPRVRVLPREDEPTLVALVDVDHRHSRQGTLGSYEPYIALRRTNRRPFRPRRVPAAVTGRLAEAARAEGAVLRLYDDPVEVTRLVDLLHAAELAERSDPELLSERRSWVGGARSDDGIPAESLGPRPRHPRTPFRDLGPSGGAAREEAGFEATPTVGVLSTEHDRPMDWVRAGQALERVLLEATASGVAASFLNQPLEQLDLRWLVRHPVTGVGHSQMVLRLGYGDEVPPTPRRPLDEVLRPPRLQP